MANTEQIKKFIKEIAPCAQKAYKALGKVKPSICIGMACVESAYGTAGSCKHHSYLGQKVGTGKTATKYWGGKFFTSRTQEEYVIGVHSTINAAFRSYESMEQCVFNYYELLNSKLYAPVKAESPYSEQMKQIKKVGYMTSSTEVNSVLSIIAKYNLIQYDGTNEAQAYPTLRKGDKNAYVGILQQKLNEKSRANLKVDSVFGNNTLIAVLEFQGMHDLTKDGIVGNKTWAALGVESK